jgi:MFS family permease
VIAGCLLSFVVTPLSGYLSDRIGRKRMYLLSATGMGIFGFIYFAMLNTLVPALMFMGIVLSWMMHGLMYGPQAALIAECFTPRLRYSGCSLGYHLAAVTGGGPAPLIATVLLAATGSGYAIAAYIAVCAIVSIIATALMPDYTNRDISEETSVNRDSRGWRYGRRGLAAESKPYEVRGDLSRERHRRSASAEPDA